MTTKTTANNDSHTSTHFDTHWAQGVSEQDSYTAYEAMLILSLMMMMIIFLNSVFRWTTEESITVWLPCTVIRKMNTPNSIVCTIACTHVTVILIACSTDEFKSDLKYKHIHFVWVKSSNAHAHLHHLLCLQRLSRIFFC